MPGYVPDPPEAPVCPSHLSTSARKLFRSLVNLLVEAKVPVKAVDCHAISLAAICLDEVQRWSAMLENAESTKDKIECAAIVARNQRDAQQWLAAIGATPKSRAQMGLRGKGETKKLGAVASILQIKQQQQANVQ